MDQLKKDSPKEKDYPKFIKTISDPKFGDIRCIFQDKDDNIWFGTRENGLYKYDGKSFHQFTVNDGLDCNNIYCILEDKEGKIWIGTEAWLCLYNGQTRFSQIKMPLPKIYLQFYKNPTIKTIGFKVWQAKRKNNGLKQLIAFILKMTNQYYTFSKVNEATDGFLTSNDKVERILEDNTGTIWLGGRTNEGVFRYDGKSITHFKLQQLIQGQNGPRPRLHNWGWPQLQDKNGNIWFSNWGGAYCYDGKTFTGFSAKDGLTVTMVAKIIEDKKGNFGN